MRVGLGVCCGLLSFVVQSCDVTIRIKDQTNGDTRPAPTDTVVEDGARNERHHTLGKPTDSRTKPKGAKECVIAEAQSLIGIHEKGSNRGAEIEAIQREAGIPIGAPYCQATVLVCYNRCGIVHAMDGRAASACVHKVSEAEPGDVICFDFNNDGRIDHSGILERIDNRYNVTIEGNTSDPDKVKAEGVYRKFRSKTMRYELGRW